MISQKGFESRTVELRIYQVPDKNIAESLLFMILWRDNFYWSISLFHKATLGDKHRIYNEWLKQDL